MSDTSTALATPSGVTAATLSAAVDAANAAPAPADSFMAMLDNLTTRMAAVEAHIGLALPLLSQTVTGVQAAVSSGGSLGDEIQNVGSVVLPVVEAVGSVLLPGAAPILARLGALESFGADLVTSIGSIFGSKHALPTAPAATPSGPMPAAVLTAGS